MEIFIYKEYIRDTFTLLVIAVLVFINEAHKINK